MSTQKILKRRTLFAASAIATAIALIAPSTAQADPVTIFDLNNFLVIASPYASGAPSLYPVSKVDISKVAAINPTVSPIGQPVSTLGDAVYMGSNIFTNHTSRDQTSFTSEFSQTINQQVSTSTTSGISVGITLTAGLDTLGSSAALNFTVSTNTTDTVATSNQISFTATAQPVTVPAGRTVEATVRLQKVMISGKMAVKAQLGGTFKPKHKNSGNWWIDLPLYDTVSAAVKDSRSPALPASLRLNPVTKTLDFTGEANYTAPHGTQFVVTLRDVTPPTAGKNSLPMAPVTYTIPAVPSSK